MPNKKPDVVWVVVFVMSGVLANAEAYRDEKTARRRMRAWRKQMRADYDDVGIFELEIGAQSGD